MILYNTNPASSLDQSVQAFWLYFKGKILDLTDTQWNDEDFKGISYFQWRTMQYYNLLYLLVLITIDIESSRDDAEDWEYYEEKYNLEAKRKCFVCEGIDFKKALEIFGFPVSQTVVDSEGIGNVGIQSTFQIEGFTRYAQPLGTITQDTLQTIISNPKGCTYNIN